MKAKGIILYASIGLNILLLALMVWPGGEGQAQVAAKVGNFTAVSAKGGGSQDALWVADRVSGRLTVYQYELGARDEPVRIVGTRNLRDDLEQRQIGNLMLISSDISSTRAAVYAIDTDSERMAIYEYNRSDLAIDGIQKRDLREDFGKTVAIE